MGNRARFINTEKIEWDIDGNFPVFTRDYFRITGASQKKADWETEVEEDHGEVPYADDFMMNQHAQQFTSFEEELRHVINKWSKEQGSGTPDFILSNYLAGCLTVLDRLFQDRADWRGEPVHPFAEPLRPCGNAGCGCSLI